MARMSDLLKASREDYSNFAFSDAGLASEVGHTFEDALRLSKVTPCVQRTLSCDEHLVYSVRNCVECRTRSRSSVPPWLP